MQARQFPQVPQRVFLKQQIAMLDSITDTRVEPGIQEVWKLGDQRKSHLIPHVTPRI